MEVIMKSEKLCVRTVAFSVASRHMTTRELIEKLEIKHNRMCYYNYATNYTTDCLKSFVEHLMTVEYFYHLNESYLHALDERLYY